MLRKYIVPVSNLVCYLSDSFEDSGEEDIPSWKSEMGQGESQFNSRLQADQAQQLNRLLERHRTVFSRTPRRTHLAEHRVNVEQPRPIQLPPY